MEYVYPAVFTPEKEGFSINFPDIESCYTCGDDLVDGIKMAMDVLTFTLYDMEEDGQAAPPPSAIGDIELNGEEFVTLVPCDTLEYRKMNNAKAVKKTLTIPQWLDEMATEKKVNFSAILQNALKNELSLE